MWMCFSVRPLDIKYQCGPFIWAGPLWYYTEVLTQGFGVYMDLFLMLYQVLTNLLSPSNQSVAGSACVYQGADMVWFGSRGTVAAVGKGSH